MNIMSKLSRKDLYSLEEYSEIRDEFRARVMEHKKNRRLNLGDHLVLFFEDRLVMHYQVQEMLKAEKIFDAEGIQEELDAYNPLIPDGTNWKATMMIQYSDVAERQQMLQKLVGIENAVWLRVGDMDKVYAIADEDLERATEEKTSAVHFLRFELTPGMISEVHRGASLSAGVEHPNHNVTVDTIADNVASSLADDLLNIQ
ncbi:MAG: DUF3501 family protein [Gammaproteobacteria bacterium]|jgi:hypothetical protein|nr:DUF3501 family protein [Gammaproteobacteria bacterium]